MAIGHAAMVGYDHLKTAAEKKVNLYKTGKGAYFMYSTLAGVYVGICMIAIMIMAGTFYNFAGLKILQGVSFAAALSLVIFAGAELFTGNVFVMVTGVMQETVKPRDAIGLCTICYLGNLAGSIFIAGLFLGTGYMQGQVREAVHIALNAKIDPLFVELIIRGFLCNLLVCAAVWCMYRMNSEGGKLIMIFWCIYLFVVCGFEHSIANMTLFSLETMVGVNSVRFASMMMNLLAVTIGNTVGGAALAMAYWPVAKGMTKSEENE